MDATIRIGEGKIVDIGALANCADSCAQFEEQWRAVFIVLDADGQIVTQADI